MINLIGISAVGVYIPRLYITAEEISRFRGWHLGFMQKGLGIENLALTDVFEDSVTMAANALSDLIGQGVNFQNVGLVVVATESNPNFSKPIASHLLGLFDFSVETEILDIKCACAGSAYALQYARYWVQNSKNAKTAIVICTDMARYAPKTKAEATQGAGAVAVLVSRNPSLITFDEGPVGVCSGNTTDFHYPCGSEYSIVNGEDSVKNYLESTLKAYKHYVAQGGLPTNQLQHLVFHTPYPTIAIKGAFQICEESGISHLAENKISSSLFAASQMGNSQNASLLFALMSLLESGNSNIGDKVGFCFYGSGYSAMFLSGIVTGQRSIKNNLAERFKKREYIAGKEYQHLKYGRTKVAQHAIFGCRVISVQNGLPEYTFQPPAMEKWRLGFKKSSVLKISKCGQLQSIRTAYRATTKLKFGSAVIIAVIFMLTFYVWARSQF